MLRVEDLSKFYGSERVLAGVDLELERENIRGFLGPNGAGKTTTFKIIAGAESHDSGTIYLDERRLDPLPIHARAREGLTFLPQEASLFRGLSVEENVMIYLRNPGTGGNGTSAEAQSSLKQLNALELKDRRAGNLSAGQGRKVEIARALALSPRYLLLDEPFSDLDPRSVAEIKKILVSLKEEEQMGIMLSDHRAKEALAITDHNYLIKEGKIIAEGSSEAIVQSDRARETYFAD